MKFRDVVKIMILFSIGLFQSSAYTEVDHTDLIGETYEGPRTCVQCHEQEAFDMFESVHYQWNGSTPNVTNISGQAGKNNMAFNTYCGAVSTTRKIVCWSCHVGYGKQIRDTADSGQLNNIDCLMCHQDQYKRKFASAPPTGDFNSDLHVNIADFSYIAQSWIAGAPISGDIDLTDDGFLNVADVEIFSRHWLETGGVEVLTFTGIDDVERTWNLPYEGDGQLTVIPDSDNMSIPLLEAAQTVHLPTRTSCLKCHATAGGADNAKRGNLSSDSKNPEYQNDVHMSPAGADLSCQDCHETVNHKVLGRGVDLRVNDRPERMTCDNGTCHSSVPHSSARLNDHTNRIACQTCHIPMYGKVVATETHRDWTQPHWVQGVYGGQGGFKPAEFRENDLEPAYFWYDGTSYVYALGDTAILRPDGFYETAVPNGSVNSDDAKIYPIKEHTTTTALHDETGQFIPYSISKYFFTGQFEQAVSDGLDELGLSGAWSIVQAHASQTINHGVEPAANALQCGDCHESLEGGGPARMELRDQLGYRIDTSPCQDGCHIEAPESPGFLLLHWKHVDEENVTCGVCHTFDRPERNLTNCNECH